MSKRLDAGYKLIERSKSYPLKDAVAVLKQLPAAKFDESVDISIKINVDPKDLTQPIRGSLVLPHGTGKTIRVAVFCKGEHALRAKEAGADIVGAADLVEKVNGGFTDFDVAIATPEMMKDIGRLGKVLGPRGLMPSPKAGTVTQDVEKAIKEVRAGKVEFKMDKLGCINMQVAKKSFDEKQIFENAQRLLEAIVHARPPQIKGKLFQNVSISTTMGPGIKIDADLL